MKMARWTIVQPEPEGGLATAHINALKIPVQYKQRVSAQTLTLHIGARRPQVSGISQWVNAWVNSFDSVTCRNGAYAPLWVNHTKNKWTEVLYHPPP